MRFKAIRKTALLITAVLFLCSGCSIPGRDYAALVPEASIPAPEFSADSSENAGRAELTLLFHPSEPLNPFLLESDDNRRLCPLLYEGLFELDSTFRAKELLCESWSCESGTEYRFVIKSGIRFSSGSELTAYDAEYSILLAMESELYASRLRNISSVSASDTYVLNISLSSPNASLPELLDVPIIPYDSGSEAAPAGTGPYMLSSDGMAFEANPFRHDDAPLPVERISLAEYTGSDVISAFENGRINLAVSSMGDSYNYGSNCEKSVFSTSNMLFLGFNCTEGVFSDASVRNALNAVIDRSALVETALSGTAQASAVPVSPGSYLWTSMLDEIFEYDPSKIYDLVDATGQINLIVRSSNRDHVAAAEYIASVLEQAGITVRLREMSSSEFNTALKYRTFDIYIGEVMLSADFDISPLITYHDPLNPGYFSSSKCSSLAADFLAADRSSKNEALSRLCSCLYEESPFMALAFGTGSLLTGRGTITGTAPTAQNIFNSITYWTVSIS